MITTKVVGGLAGSLLVFMLINWAAGGIFTVAPAEGPDGTAQQAYTVEVEEADTSDDKAGTETASAQDDEGAQDESTGDKTAAAAPATAEPAEPAKAGDAGEETAAAAPAEPAKAGATDAGGSPPSPGATDIGPLLASADAAKGAKVFSKCKACHKLDDKNAIGPHLDGVIGRPIASADGFSYSDALKKLGGEDWTPQRFSEFLTDPGAYAPGTKMTIKLPKAEDRANLIAYLESQK